MKKIKIFTITIFICFIAFFSSCNKKNDEAQYEVINQSDYDVIISSYDNLNMKNSRFINLKANGGIYVSDTYIVPVGRVISPIQVYGSDSVIVDFASQRRQSFSLNTTDFSDRNILSIDNYEWIDVDEFNRTYRFTLTNQDYENAEEIVD